MHQLLQIYSCKLSLKQLQYISNRDSGQVYKPRERVRYLAAASFQQSDLFLCPHSSSQKFGFPWIKIALQKHKQKNMWGVLHIIHLFFWMFPCKLSILGYPHVPKKNLKLPTPTRVQRKSKGLISSLAANRVSQTI